MSQTKFEFIRFCMELYSPVTFKVIKFVFRIFTVLNIGIIQVLHKYYKSKVQLGRYKRLLIYFLFNRHLSFINIRHYSVFNYFMLSRKDTKIVYHFFLVDYGLCYVYNFKVKMNFLHVDNSIKFNFLCPANINVIIIIVCSLCHLATISCVYIFSYNVLFPSDSEDTMQ